MKEKNEHINDLLNRFFEGQTTCNEEQELYLFFMQDDVPEEFIRYKPVIKYFESGLADELGLSVQRPSHTAHTSKKRWIVWSGVAASFLLMLFTSLYFLKNKDASDPFEGSYIIRNGVRITDINLIRPELEATIQKSIKQQLETEQFFADFFQVDNRVEMEILQQMFSHYDRILENIQDEEIRKEVRKIIYTNF